MFQIILSPQASPIDDTPPIVSGDTLTYRGIQYDFSPLPEGGQIVVDSPFEEAVYRQDGVIYVKLTYRYNWDTSEDYQSNDWGDYTFSVNSGKCPCPIKRKPKGAK